MQDVPGMPFKLRQGELLVADYGTLAAESGCNEAALLCALHHGLNESVREALVAECALGT